MAKRNGKKEEVIFLTKKEIINSVLNTEIKVIAKNESQKELIRSIKGNEITICKGKAGTGKTYVSLAFALSLLKNRSNTFNKIYLVKSVTTLKGEEIGYLKGNLQEKIEPFMWSFLINMEKMINENVVKELIGNDLVRPFPLAYARGTTLDNAIIIADEMQNISIDNARTLLTRIGKNSKMILLGDTEQIDLRKKGETSLEPLMNMFKNVKEIGCIIMDDKDINVRNPLINVMEQEFNNYYNENYKIKTVKLLPNGKG
jgi:phosphate starvation-inducible PhoH-like protein